MWSPRIFKQDIYLDVDQKMFYSLLSILELTAEQLVTVDWYHPKVVDHPWISTFSFYKFTIL